MYHLQSVLIFTQILVNIDYIKNTENFCSFLLQNMIDVLDKKVLIQSNCFEMLDVFKCFDLLIKVRFFEDVYIINIMSSY